MLRTSTTPPKAFYKVSIMGSVTSLFDDVVMTVLVSLGIRAAVAGMLDIVLVAASGSFAVSALIILTQCWHGRHSLDGDLTGIQKFHKRAVPRIGGIALLFGIFVVLATDVGSPPDFRTHTNDSFVLLLAALPAFVAGFSEDLTKNVSIKARMFATLASALLACWMLGAYLPRLDVWMLDSVLRFLPAAVIVTAVAVSGVTNSINIIDGFHGLAGATVVVLLAALGYLAWQAGDVLITRVALLGIGTTIGFLLLNYPSGLLFMGDGGAYLLGFWVAEVAVLLIVRNAAINAWQVLAICSYPVIEVLYSIYRKKFIRKMSPGAPDRLHLHMLLYRRVVCQKIPRTHPWVRLRNAAVACLVIPSVIATTLLAVWLGDTVSGAVILVTLYGLLYIAVYIRLVRGQWCSNLVDIFGLRPRAINREIP